MNNKIIILAPHLKYPPRNGGDIYVEKIGYNLSLFREQVTILGAHTVTYYNNGETTNQQAFQNDFRVKFWAALRTLALNSHYLIEKFLTNAYRQKASDLVLDDPKATIIYSYISTASLELTTKPAIILTQNDEIAWFQDQCRFSKNPLQKRTARMSENWIKKFLQHRAEEFFFAHITEGDYHSYKRWMPGHNGFVVPVGVDIEAISNDLPLDGVIHLLFVGSLSSKMNCDALTFFQERFWGILKDEFKQRIELTVLGSQPTGVVRQLCMRENWQLISDASEEELHTQYKHATFAILPFPYTNGAKLKLLNALAAGLPVLATSNMKILDGQVFAPNLYSDEPQEWLSHIREIKDTGILPSQRLSCQQYAGRYTWREIAANMDNKLRELGM
jgi:glycosyltransferase involved in cell wall biosynthesis